MNRLLQSCAVASLVAASSLIPSAAEAQVPSLYTINSGRSGTHLAVVESAGSGTRLHVVFQDGSDVYQWEPYSNALAPLTRGRWAWWDGSRYSFVVLGDNGMPYDDLVVFDADTGWNLFSSAGEHPSSFAGKVVFGRNDAGDWDINYWDGSGVSVFLSGNGRDERRASLYHDRFSYEVDVGGKLDVEIFDIPTQHVVGAAPDLGNEYNADLVGTAVAYESDAKPLFWYDYVTGVQVAVPVQGVCASYGSPRLGDFGEWVVYEAIDCGGRNELWLFSAATGSHFYVDDLLPVSSGEAPYHIVGTQLAYLDAHGSVVYVELDAHNI